MKKTHKLENGTILEVGKRYALSSWKKEAFIEIITIGEWFIFAIDEDKYEDVFLIKGDWLPYQEEKEKDLVGHVLYFVEWKEGGSIDFISWRKKRPEEDDNYRYLTLQEAEERGLDVSFFKK